MEIGPLDQNWVDTVFEYCTGRVASELRTGDRLERAFQFYNLLVFGNSQQNLTTAIDPGQFADRHLLDVVQLYLSGYVGEGIAGDIGSGGGIPGLLYAALFESRWRLIESEKAKTIFLERAAEALGLEDIQVLYSRFESLPTKSVPTTLVARAVTQISTFEKWLKPCSTWNKLILFKGPAWETEWADYIGKTKTPYFKINRRVEYPAGKGAIRRVIVELVRS